MQSPIPLSTFHSRHSYHSQSHHPHDNQAEETTTTTTNTNLQRIRSISISRSQADPEDTTRFERPPSPTGYEAPGYPRLARRRTHVDVDTTNDVESHHPHHNQAEETTTTASTTTTNTNLQRIRSISISRSQADPEDTTRFNRPPSPTGYEAPGYPRLGRRRTHVDANTTKDVELYISEGGNGIGGGGITENEGDIIIKGDSDGVSIERLISHYAGLVGMSMIGMLIRVGLVALGTCECFPSRAKRAFSFPPRTQ